MRSEITATRADIAATVQQATGLPLIQSRQLVDGILKHIDQALGRGEDIILRGFGSFHVVAKAERVGMNIRKREKVVITARQVVTFRPGAEMRSRVAKGMEDQ